MGGAIWGVHTLPKTNMAMENHHVLRKYMLEWLLFHCHVSFHGCSNIKAFDGQISLDGLKHKTHQTKWAHSLWKK